MRRAAAMRLTLLVALSGLLPIGIVGVVSLELLARRSERMSQEALRSVAQQAAARIGTYLSQERELLRALAAALSAESDAERKFAEVPLDAPSMQNLALVSAANLSSRRPQSLSAAQLSMVFAGHEVSSPVYLASDLTPAMDVCVPSRALAAHAVCATFDLLELQRQVQRIHVGTSGYALAFDASGRLLASGAGALRASVISGEPLVESSFAALAAKGGAPPLRYVGSLGEDVIAGWASLTNPDWIVTIAQPAREALATARVAEIVLALVALAALLISLVLGVAQSSRILGVLEAEERWRTAGLIASGITHDLGHRLAILQQTAALAETNDPLFLPQIRDNLSAEVATLRRFVADFADLTRPAQPAEFLPLDLDAFLRSVCATAAPLATRMEIELKRDACDAPPWILGDRYLIERATLNLIHNALEASPRGASVHVRVAREGESAIIQVIDPGVGIAADRLPHLFDAFASTKRTGAHIGVGLPNVRRIARAHGGDVSAISEAGKGATFTIRLPLAPAPQEART